MRQCVIVHSLFQRRLPVLVQSNSVETFNRKWNSVRIIGIARNKLGNQFLHCTQRAFGKQQIQGTKHLINIFVSVTDKIKIQFDLGENAQLDKQAQKGENVLILVLTPTIVHLQVQDWGKLVSRINDPQEGADNDLDCEISVMLPEGFHNPCPSFEPMHNDSNDTALVRNKGSHLFWLLPVMRNICLVLIHTIDDHAQVLVALLFEGLCAFSDVHP